MAESDIQSMETIESNVQPAEITFKTIPGEVFKLTLPLSTTVGAIKEQIFNDKGENFEVERQKLIYAGKVLEDSQTLEDVKVDEKKFVVVMVSKKKAQQPVYTSSTPSNISSNAPPNVATPVPTTTPISTGLTVTPEQEETITMICEMGYERDQTVKALRAAYWSADRAVEYLCNGIPEVEGPFNQAGGLQPDIGENPLAYLAENPQFAEIAQIIRSDPAFFSQFMRQVSTSSPHLMRDISSNPEAFVQILNQAGRTSGNVAELVGMLGSQAGSHSGGNSAQLPGLEQLAGMLEQVGGQGGLTATQLQGLNQSMQMLGQAGGENTAQLQGLNQLMQMLGQAGGQGGLTATQLQGLNQSMQMLGQAGGENTSQLQGLNQLMQMLGQAGGQEGGNAAQFSQSVTIPVTEEDRSAIQRLRAMGFDEQTVIEAYFACDKNEELAVNYILSRMADPSDN